MLLSKLSLLMLTLLFLLICILYFLVFLLDEKSAHEKKNYNRAPIDARSFENGRDGSHKLAHRCATDSISMSWPSGRPGALGVVSMASPRWAVMADLIYVGIN